MNMQKLAYEVGKSIGIRQTVEKQAKLGLGTLADLGMGAGAGTLGGLATRKIYNMLTNNTGGYGLASLLGAGLGGLGGGLFRGAYIDKHVPQLIQALLNEEQQREMASTSMIAHALKKSF